MECTISFSSILRLQLVHWKVTFFATTRRSHPEKDSNLTWTISRSTMLDEHSVPSGKSGTNSFPPVVMLLCIVRLLLSALRYSSISLIEPLLPPRKYSPIYGMVVAGLKPKAKSIGNRGKCQHFKKVEWREPSRLMSCIVIGIDHFVQMFSQVLLLFCGESCEHGEQNPIKPLDLSLTLGVIGNR